MPASVQVLDMLPSEYSPAVWRVNRADICFWAATTLFIYDYLASFLEEISIWSEKKTLALLAFLSARYSTVAMLIATGLWLYAPVNCHLALLVVFLCWALISIGCALIFATRATALCDDSRWVKRMIWAAFTAVAVAWVSILPTARSDFSDVKILSMSCTSHTAHGSVRWRIVAWLASMMFDALLFAFTFVTIRGTTNSLLQRMTTTHVLYFSFATALNLTMVILHLVSSDYLSPLIPTPLVFVLQTVLLTRMTLALRNTVVLPAELPVSDDMALGMQGSSPGGGGGGGAVAALPASSWEAQEKDELIHRSVSRMSGALASSSSVRLALSRSDDHERARSPGAGSQTARAPPPIYRPMSRTTSQRSACSVADQRSGPAAFRQRPGTAIAAPRPSLTLETDEVQVISRPSTAF